MRPICTNISMKSGLAVSSSLNSSMTRTSEGTGWSAAPASRARS
ncbi:hypothetical protein SXANM310S_03855 [Streptomyces xanthochromogenes]